jgi:cytochrome b subunit of formate dehydrogenase
MIIVGIIAHLAAFIFKANRPLLPGMFTGYVDEEYVRKRHSLWYEKLQKKLSS